MRMQSTVISFVVGNGFFVLIFRSDWRVRLEQYLLISNSKVENSEAGLDTQ